MGTAAAIITAAVAATAAIAKGVRAAKDRKERRAQQGKVQDQLSETKGNYEAYRRDAATDRGNVMHAKMEMYGPVFEQMKEMYGKGGYEVPDFEAAMRMNESRPNAPDASRPIKDSGSGNESRPDPKPKSPGSYQDEGSGHTYATSGTKSNKQVKQGHSRGGIDHTMNTTGNKSDEEVKQGHQRGDVSHSSGGQKYGGGH